MFIQQKAKNKCYLDGSECISEDYHIEDSVKGQESPYVFVVVQYFLTLFQCLTFLPALLGTAIMSLLTHPLRYLPVHVILYHMSLKS